MSDNDNMPGSTVIPINRYAKIEVDFDGKYFKSNIDDSTAEANIPEQRQTLEEFEAMMKAYLRWYRFTVNPDFGMD